MELTRDNFRAIIFYDFKAGLNQEEYVQRLQLAFGDESPARAIVFRWFKAQIKYIYRLFTQQFPCSATFLHG